MVACGDSSASSTSDENSLAKNSPTINNDKIKEDIKLLQQQTNQAKIKRKAPAKAWLEAEQVYNKEAPIPPQCYTKTEQVHNPCYVCHQSYRDQDDRPNKLNDGFQQGSYAFSDVGVENSWRNLFKDRTGYIEKVSDQEITDYIKQDNYTPFIKQLKDSEWSGVIPEVTNLHLGAQAFDEHGLAKDGSRWVAFNYKPLPSTFWPTNGATDDVMIRLPNAFSEVDGRFSKDIYYINLSLVELALVDGESTTIFPINETQLNIDINGDGRLSDAVTSVMRKENYVGDASDIALTHMLYPQGTSFLHTVRYVDFDEHGKVTVSPRMKEVRYMTKKRFLTPGSLKSRFYLERKEKHFEQLPYANDFGDEGLSNKHGWLLSGFIEDEKGHLRKQNHEELFFCTGCHKSMGATIDDTMSFPRKVKGVEGWGYIDLYGVADAPNVGEEEGEYLTYLERVAGGDEFRQNSEMLERWFDKDGQVKKDKVAALTSIAELIAPSQERAMQLNKAYKAIVDEQSYIYGRDVVIKPNGNVFETVDEEVAPLFPEHRHEWDIRLQWDESASVDSVSLN